MDGITLVLGGGGSRGLAHVGVLQALEEYDIPIARIVGTSIGSLVGALYAYHRCSHKLLQITDQTGLKDLVKKAINIFKGLSKGQGIADFIAQHTKDASFDQLDIPFSAVCVDLNSGDLIELDQGSVAKAVQCSCALPPIFHPVVHQGRTLVDGGAIASVPVVVAKRYPASQIVAVNVGIELPEGNPKLALPVMHRYGLIRIRELDRRCAQDADVVIRPHIPGAKILDDSNRVSQIAAGYSATIAQIDQIKDK